MYKKHLKNKKHNTKEIKMWENKKKRYKKKKAMGCRMGLRIIWIDHHAQTFDLKSRCF